MKRSPVRGRAKFGGSFDPIVCSRQTQTRQGGAAGGETHGDEGFERGAESEDRAAVHASALVRAAIKRPSRSKNQATTRILAGTLVEAGEDGVTAAEIGRE